MANEKLTIQKNEARLRVIGNSYPDELTNSGDGEDTSMDLIDILDDLGIDLPDINPDDWDNIPAIIGLDDDGDPVLVFPDPDTGILIEWPLDDLDWDDFLDNNDLDWEDGLDITGLNIDGLDSLAWLDADLNVHIDDLPTSIQVVFPPNKTKYLNGQAINIAGMYVYAYDAEGNVWRGTGKIDDKYRNGRVPNEELKINPQIARTDVDPQDGKADISEVNSMWYSYGPWGGLYWPNIVLWNAHGPLDVYFSGLNNQTPSPVRLQWNEEHKLYVGNIDIWGYNPSPIYGPATLNGYSLVPYGDEDYDSEKQITVIWNRPGDGKELTTTFTISVSESKGGGGR